MSTKLSPSKKSCLSCQTGHCYRWYDGPTCANCYRRAKYAENPEKVRQQIYQWRTYNANKAKEYSKRSYRKHRSIRIAEVKKWISMNPEKAKLYNRKSARKHRIKMRNYGKIHYRTKKYLYRAKDARRRAALLKRIPNWANLSKIKQIYKNRPPKFHVDHIIPLQGKSVSGLHVVENLQYLSVYQNLSKGNSYE